MLGDRTTTICFFVAGAVFLNGCAGIPSLQKAETLPPGQWQFGITTGAYTPQDTNSGYGRTKVIPDFSARVGLIPNLDSGVQLGLIKAEIDLKYQLIDEDEFPLPSVALGAGAQALNNIMSVGFPTGGGQQRLSQHAMASLYLSKTLGTRWTFCSSYRSLWSRFEPIHDYVGEFTDQRSNLISAGFYFAATPYIDLVMGYDFLWPGDVYGTNIHNLTFGAVFQLPNESSSSAARESEIDGPRAAPPRAAVTGPRHTVSLYSGAVSTLGLEYEHWSDYGVLAFQVSAGLDDFWQHPTRGVGAAYRFFLVPSLQSQRRGLWVGPALEILLQESEGAWRTGVVTTGLELGWKFILGESNGFMIAPKFLMGYSDWHGDNSDSPSSLLCALAVSLGYAY